jgi:hypothetical protein
MREVQGGASQRSPSLLLYIAVQESCSGLDTPSIYKRVWILVNEHRVKNY